MMKIGEVSKTFNISNRTLRYWEDKNILKSIRAENGYRFYDDNSIKSIKQIVLLRKLNVPIGDIECIFKSQELNIAIKILSRHLENTIYEANTLNALSIVIEKLIAIIRHEQDFTKALIHIDTSDDFVSTNFKNALLISLSERNTVMSKSNSIGNLDNVRIIQLPKMVFACYRAESESPEEDCSKVTNEFILKYDLNQKLGFRHFGFNNPSPTKSSDIYGYEMWFVIPEDFEVPSPLWKMKFDGGLYAAIPTTMNIIGERWQLLSSFGETNDKYDIDWNPDNNRICLEECIDYKRFMDENIDFNEKQLDLLMPIKLK
ncbi:MerR family transcriptional regulator [Clostridiaceae bacterium M8S5]|nr:MerR family transcriptional regulator [Clostridiaceae bacterium M8S5]